MILSRPFRLFLIFLLVLLAHTSLSATHIVGGEMTYECQGPASGNPSIMRYEITLTVYRDCSLDGTNARGGGFDSDATDPMPDFVAPGTVSVYRGSETVEFLSINLTQPVISLVAVDIGNPCLVVPPDICVQKGIYTFFVNLPIATVPYTIVYQRCCRNPTITNILLPNTVGASYFTTIDPVSQELCNSSPTFDFFPPIVLCAGENFELPMNGTDPDGDRLVYYLCSPVVGGGRDGNGSTADPYDDVAPDPDRPPPYDNVDFNAPSYTAQRPLGPMSEFMYNDSTGLLSGNPALQGQFVVGICIDEFRGDTLLSSTKREFQFNITNCANTVLADLREDSIAPDGRFVIDICGPGEFTIVNESTDQAFIENYTWNLVGVNGDPITGTLRDLTATINEAGSYNGIMLLNNVSNFSNCKDSAEFTINIFPDLRANFEYAYDECVAGPVTFTDLSEADDPGGITRFNWSFADGNASVAQNPIHNYQIPGNFNVGLTITDGNGCQNSIVQPIEYFPAPPILVVRPSVVRGCTPQEVFFNNLSIPIDDSYDIVWEFGDNSNGTSGEISPTYTYEDVGIYDVSLSVTSPIGCFIDTVFENLVQVFASPTAGFSFTPEAPNNLMNVVDFMDESRDAIAWSYTLGDIFRTSQPNFSFEFRDTGVIVVTQIVTHPSGCLDTFIREIDVVPILTVHVPNAFTPNGDGLNDVFIPKAVLFGYKSYSFNVWNRWGERIFTTEDPDVGWNGQFNNADSPAGGYLWDLTVVNARDEPQKYKGSVVLLR